MPIEIKGAKEHNLQIDHLFINDGLTVVTGVSGSGKSSLVFNTIYQEASRQFHDIFGIDSTSKANPALVDEITGLKPSIAIDQNALNQNPNSTLASASGLHPLIRILFARYGVRKCYSCNSPVQLHTKDEIIDVISVKSMTNDIKVKVPIVINQNTISVDLEKFLLKVFPDNVEIKSEYTPTVEYNSLYLFFNIQKKSLTKIIREIIDLIDDLGFQRIVVSSEYFSWGKSCPICNAWLLPIEPKLFHSSCPICKGNKCISCNFTGLHPQTVGISWNQTFFIDLLAFSVKDALQIFKSASTSEISPRLQNEIFSRLKALERVGLEYVTLDRPIPSLSRGESQRVRLALALINNLEDMLFILDEPTIGLHIKNVIDIMPEFRNLKGSVIFVEHDKVAAAYADNAIEIGPGAGQKGGKVVFTGTTSDLWNSSTITGQYFSKIDKTSLPKKRNKINSFLTIEHCSLHNLKDITVNIPYNQVTVVTGVSGSGKTTFAVDVLGASLQEKKPIGCLNINNYANNVILVDQSPIGRNPRSNPATYTKLADLIRDVFSKKSNLNASFFSFNRQDGACPECKGIGSIEIKMTYLPSTWILCEKCNGKKFNDEVLHATVSINGKFYSIDDILSMTIEKAYEMLINSNFFDIKENKSAGNIFNALIDVGLGYLQLGQPSPTLSGGEAQRIKLAKFLGKSKVSETIFILDEPSTGLHPADLSGLLIVFERLLKQGATIIVIEHNSDIINSADWIIDLGPGSGDNGGELLYCGDLEGFRKAKRSITNQMILKEQIITPTNLNIKKGSTKRSSILTIKEAKIHNLQNIDVEFPKNSLNVITGVSGSGKSSLVTDILETEARRRFLESLSMYERQSIHEGAEIDAVVEGLGVTFSIGAKKERFYLRNTVGFNTGLSQQFAIIFSQIGIQYCDHCQWKMEKQNLIWTCPKCNKTFDSATPRHFSSRNYSSACLKCHGVGTISVPNPSKLIIHPEKPLCKGAMYSPGFFPKGYLCKEGNGGYYYLRALGNTYNFDPEITPWNKMTEEAQNAFLFGSDKILEYDSIGQKGHHHLTKQKNGGFYYGFVREWDVGGTYTDHIHCPECQGAGLRNQFLHIRILDLNYDKVQNLSFGDLIAFIESFKSVINDDFISQVSYKKIHEKLQFLNEVGLSYINLKRTMGTLSAGEAQRIKLASFLGSNIQGLTITLDEPTRGMHPKEIGSLIRVLKSLVSKNNTLLVIEHDLDIIKSADFLVELGPKSGKEGGLIVNKGKYSDFFKFQTITTKWLQKSVKIPKKTKIKKPLTFLKLIGAKENNLKGDTLEIPLGCMVGICGVSGSGKSTLIIDTLGRIISPQKHTTSVAYEPLKPGNYESLENVPEKAIIIDQVKKGISSPLTYFEMEKNFVELYLDSDDFIQSELDEEIFKQKCSRCKGDGLLKTDMGFLPPIYSECDTCSGTGLIPESWDIKLYGFALPELYKLTIDEICEIFKKEQTLLNKLEIIQKLGLGYLTLKQPAYSLSGGEVQRLKIAKELTKKKSNKTLFLLDEPSIGLHMEDISILLKVLHSIVEEDNTVVIVEHHPFILASCDWLIELGPVGGEKGGYIINKGTPDEFIKHSTPTSLYIKEVLE